jgi:hypothetical protein
MVAACLLLLALFRVAADRAVRTATAT